MKLNLQVLCAAAALCASMSSHATPTTKYVGSAVILGTTYNVSVLYDSAGVYNAQSFQVLNPSITFTNASDAQTAASTLMATFGATYDWNPGSSATGGSIPYAANATQYSYVTLNNGNIGGPFENYAQFVGNNFSFVQFTAAAVPEVNAAAMLLAGLGFVGLTLRGRRSAR